MQDKCYVQMSQLINKKWGHFFPKSNLIWIKYVIHKLLRSKAIEAPTEDMARLSVKVKVILHRYNQMMDKFSNSNQCFNHILDTAFLNDYVKITVDN